MLAESLIDTTFRALRRSLPLQLLLVGLVTTTVHSCGPSQAETKTKIRSDMQGIERGLAQFAADHAGRYPETLYELVSGPVVYPRTHKRIAAELPRDPWDNDYAYVPTSDRTRPNVICYGADGEPGGESASADVELNSR